MEEPSNLVAARNFARSLNILLKTVRLYGTEHERTNSLMGTAWDDLRQAMKLSGDAGLLMGVSGGQILLDGVPLEKRPTDRSFAQLLSTAGLASINFSSRVTLDNFWVLVRAFASHPAKSGKLAAELNVALGGENGTIRVNEVRYVAQDPSLGDAGLAAHLAIRSLGTDAQKLETLLRDPQRLLQFIGAAEGARSQSPGNSASGGGNGVGGAGASSVGVGASAFDVATRMVAARLPDQPAQEDDVFRVLQWLEQLGQAAARPESPEQSLAIQKNLRQLPLPGQAALAQALMSLNSQSDPVRPDDPMLVQLAERVAVRFALERYERGDMRTNAVVELMDRLKQEVNSLRQILTGHEEQMGRAGMAIESHADILDRQFWARLPERLKQKMLLSPEAWAAPPRNIRQFVEELLGRGDVVSARAILDNYVRCISSPDVNARRKVAAGLTEMADLFSRTSDSLFQSSFRRMGEALGAEGNADLQVMLGAAFVRFSHEAAARRQYPAVHEALEAMGALEQRQPGLARLLWPRVKVGNPLPEFIEEALHTPQIPEGLVDVLRKMVPAAVDHVASLAPACRRRDQWERMLEIVQDLGPEAVAHLRKVLQTRPAAEAASRVALLSRLGPGDLEQLLPIRLRDWDPVAHDVVVRQLANSLAPQRGKLLDAVYELLHAAVLPEVIDELGISGDPDTSARLMRILERGAAGQIEPYLYIKAIEALGRLRVAKAETLLRLLAEGKRFWRWTHPREVRIAAMQSLRKIDPDWTEHFVPRCNVSWGELTLAALDPDADSPWLRQRRYLRVPLPRPLNGVVRADRTEHRASFQQLSLGGGVCRSQCHVKPGSTIPIEIESGLRRIQASVLVREARPQELSFEFVQIRYEDLSRLRHSLVSVQTETTA